MKLYVISTKYQPLVNVNMQPEFGKKPVSQKNISAHDLQTTFNASKNNPLIACDNKDDALVVMSLLIKGHNTTADFIERGIRIFAVPVVYTVEVESGALSDQMILTANDLIDYADTTTIPLYSSCDLFKNAEKSLINQGLQKYSKDITIRKLSGLEFDAVKYASYLDASATDIVDVNLKPSLNRLFSFFRSFVPGAEAQPSVTPRLSGN